MREIVIIEDDDDSWLLLKALLVRNGYRSEQLVRYTSIAEIPLSGDRPEIILTDLTLPDSSPAETFKRVCRLFPGSPIIVITGNADADIGVRLIKEGAQDYLIKGDIDSLILNKSIQYAIERKRVTTDYERIFANNPTPMYILDDVTFDILAVNDATIAKYGYTRQQLLRMNATDIRPAEEVTRFRQFAGVQTDDEYDAGKWQHRKSDGTIFAVHVYVHNTEFNGRAARMVVAIDIDKELKAEQALVHEEQNLRSIINNTDDVIWSVDRDFNIISANDAFWRYVSRLTGKTGRTLAEADFNNELFAAWNKLFDRGMKGNAFKTVWTNTFDGIDQVSEISFNPIRNAEGEVIGLSCFARDMTELRNQLKRIELQNAQLKEIAWIQSHKVRSHVATILGLTQLVTAEAAGDSTTRFILDGIRKSSEELDTVIHEITEKTKTME